MDFITIPEEVVINYSVPPLVFDNTIKLFNNKGSRYYRIYYTAFTSCIASLPNECVHDILISYSLIDDFSINFKNEELTFHNVKYDDIKKQGYIPLMIYKKFESKKTCKLFNS
jgi:hypothetical protein